MASDDLDTETLEMSLDPLNIQGSKANHRRMQDLKASMNRNIIQLDLKKEKLTRTYETEMNKIKLSEDALVKNLRKVSTEKQPDYDHMYSPSERDSVGSQIAISPRITRRVSQNEQTDAMRKSSAVTRLPILESETRARSNTSPESMNLYKQKLEASSSVKPNSIGQNILPNLDGTTSSATLNSENMRTSNELSRTRRSGNINWTPPITRKEIAHRKSSVSNAQNFRHETESFLMKTTVGYRKSISGPVKRFSTGNQPVVLEPIPLDVAFEQLKNCRYLRGCNNNDEEIK